MSPESAPVSNPYRKILSIAEKYTVKGIENVSNPYRKILSVGVWACVAVIVGFQSLQEDSKQKLVSYLREIGVSFQSLQEDSKLREVNVRRMTLVMFPILTGRF